MIYFVTYKEGGRFVRVTDKLTTKKEVIKRHTCIIKDTDGKVIKVERPIIVFPDDSVYDGFLYHKWSRTKYNPEPGRHQELMGLPLTELFLDGTSSPDFETI